MRLIVPLVALCLLAAFTAPAHMARAQEEGGSIEERQAVEQGREALENAGDLPWYDSETDSVRRIEVRSQPAPAAPQQTNQGRKKPAGTTRPNFSLSPLWEVLRWAILVILVIALVAVVIFSVRYITSSQIDVHGRSGGEDDLRSQIERIENLPFRMKRTFSNLLEEARHCYEQGNFNEAIIYLYSYELVHLDKRHLIRLTKGKTNRQYVREVKPRGEISGVLAETMLAFEEVFFGNHDLPRPRFEQCWNRLDEFHQMVDQHTAA